MAKKVSISQKIAALSADDKKIWIAARKKDKPNIDWEGETAKVKVKK